LYNNREKGWFIMSIKSLQNLNFNPQVIPNFNTEKYKLLQEFSVGIEIPQGTNTLADRITEFNKVTHDLAKETKWNKTMPWVIAAIEVSLIAATVLGFVFGGLAGLIPLIALCVFEAGCATAAGAHADIILPPFGAIFYVIHLINRQSRLENRHKVLNQELPGDIRQAAVFWQKHGTDLLQKVQEAEKQVTISPSEPAADESFKQTEARLKADLQQAQAAQKRRDALEELIQEIQIGQKLLVPSAPALED
jgi:hypothetical protein